MDKKKAILLSITILFIGLLTSIGSYAFWSWNSNTNKNVVFNVAKKLRNYIVYDEGESTFAGDFKVSNTYNQGMHSTIKINKTSEAANVALTATIHMDINAIGANMKESSALKWVVTEGDATNPGTVLAKGNFMGSNAGDTLTLVPNIEVTTTVKKYTIWIWLDASENPSDALSGETLDTNVWTEINQTPGVEDRYEVTRISADYQNISATVVNNKNKIVKYAITTESTEPASNSAAWKTIEPATDQTNVYTLNKTVDATGTYYVWFKDELDRVVNAEIEVEEIDNSAPSCSFGSWNKQSIANNETAQITLTCTDNESVLTNNTINISNITTSNTYITVTNVAKEQITNGYKYTVTVKGTETDGNTTLTLQENVVKNAVHLGNASVTSTAMTVANVYTVTYESGNSSCTLNETTYGSKTQTYGQAFTIANPSCAGYTFAGWTANSGLDTTNAKYGNSSSAVTTTWSNASTPTKATWFNNLALRSTKAVTLTATWTANDLTFSGATLAEGTYGTAYTSGAFTAASNGSGNYKYTIKSGAPTGASIDGTNGANRKIKFTNTTAAGTYNVAVTATDSTTGKTKDATFVVKINKQTVNAPTNVAVGTDGKVTWTASSNATGYQISIDNTNWESATSGKDYLSTVTAATGSRTVYVRAVNSDTANYTTPSTNATKAVTVYSVTLTKGTGISAVTGAGNYISGATVTLGATVSAGYTWSKWTQTSGGAEVSTTKAYSAAISSNWAYTANAVDATVPTVQDIAGGTTLKATSQNLTLKCTDNIEVTAYYFGTTNPNTADKITTTTAADLTALQGSGLTKSVNAAGTYYLGCKDAAGNIASKSIVIRKYQVQNVLEKIAGTTGTYTSANYENSGSAATYYIKNGTSLTLASIYSIPTGAAAGTFKGYTTSAPGTSAASPSTTAPTVATNNTTVYYMWFNRNTYKVTASKPTNGTVKIETVTKGNNSVTASTAAAELTVKYGDTVKATATASTGYDFSEWSGGYISGTTNPTTGAAITAAKTITASFLDLTPPTGTLTTELASNAVVATVNATDNGSGVKESYAWKLSNNSTCDDTVSFVDVLTTNNYNFNVAEMGIHYVCVRIEDNAGNKNYISKIAQTSYLDYDYLGDYETFTAFEDGYYKVEAWGAQGGSASSIVGGTGAYTSGYIYLNQNENLYVYVGGSGKSTSNAASETAEGGWNGGGSGFNSTSTGRYAGSGGGATDIRLVNGTWNNDTSLNSRIMVAAGGAGTWYYNASYKTTVVGDGGALFGVTGKGNNNGSTTTAAGGTPTATNFGFGANGTTTGYPGGGSGYYGGNNQNRTAGGGSSFISGYAGVNAITSASDRTHKDNIDHYSGKYFIDGEMIAANNSGDGKAKITYIGSGLSRTNLNLNNVKYIKDCINGSSKSTANQWVELQAVLNGVNIAKGRPVTGTSAQKNATTYAYSYIVDGKIDNITSSSGFGVSTATGNQCITVELDDTYDLDEIAVWHYYTDGRTFNENITYVSANNFDWVEVINVNEPETDNGKRVSAWGFEYEGYTITFDANGGSGAPGPITYIYADSGTINLPATVPTTTVSGYGFVGWATSPTATTATYLAGDAYPKNIAENITLYAVWGEATVSFHYTGSYKICYGANYNKCETKSNESEMVTSPLWKLYLLTGDSATLTINSVSSNVDVFLVGGGGGGAKPSTGQGSGGGGGGGGGHVSLVSNIALATGAHSVTIGSGGAGATADGGSGSTGGTTSLSGCSGCTAAGGNGATGKKGAAGGSGGGGGSYHTGNPMSCPGYSQGGVNGSDGHGGVNLNNSCNNLNAGGAGDGVPTTEFQEDGALLYAGGGNGALVFYALYTDEKEIFGQTVQNASNSGGASSYQDGVANRGGGGGGGFVWNYLGKYLSKNAGSGGSGVVVIRNHS